MRDVTSIVFCQFFSAWSHSSIFGSFIWRRRKGGMEGGGGLLIFSRLFVLSKIFFILAFGLVLLGETIKYIF
ncbi:unnamed protein product [Meloidogyne enterolobii]|uniref:Uncharacterized protein n=1 Tax=Meloidogyne enterolobii TaxID=390850 RepID=A0ACB0Y0Y1_MELEN